MAKRKSAFDNVVFPDEFSYDLGNAKIEMVDNAISIRPTLPGLRVISLLMEYERVYLEFGPVTQKELDYVWSVIAKDKKPNKA